ncbi:MAG: signal peptidase II [Proteobacteria bacterium]|nr:signal peptidase II [Pseudomonadota bacterium]
MLIYILFILIFVGLDQWIKILVRQNLTGLSNIEVIPNFIHLTHQENRGISFSMLSDLPDSIRVPLLSGISLVVVLIMLIYLYLKWEKIITLERWGFSLVLSGAIGNLIDRAFRQEVTDYMHFHFYDKSFFVNNLADDLISLGFVFMVYASFKDKAEEK